ncbi:MAG: type IV secretion system protein [Nitrospirales bacterium]|nr:hypothetical protein [Nitrospirales bacterium]
MKCVGRMLCVMVLSVGVGVATVPAPAKASGIPTVDIAQIVQSLTSYITDLQGFSELIIQTGLEESQLASLLQQYTQTLREYKSYLNQLRSLQEFISAPDWAALIKIVVQSPYGKEVLGQIPLLDPEGPDYNKEVRQRAGEYGPVPQETESVVEGYTDLGVDAGDLAHIEAYNDGLNQNFSKYAQQMNIVTRNQKAIEEREEKVNEYMDNILNLGDESDLATLQLMASQQNLAGHQREAILRTLNQMQLTYESPSTALANRRAGFVDQEIERLKKVHADSTNHTLGRDRWATDW